MRLNSPRLLATLLALAWLPLQLPAQKTATAVVAQLYRDFAWEAVVEEPDWPGHGLLDQPRSLLSRYFDDTLVSLILKDRACAKRTKEVCRLDELPIWDSQDPAATALKIAATPDPTVVTVGFRYPANGQQITLAYHLVKTRAGWRIHDIVSHIGGSLLARLTPSGAP